MKPGYKSTEAWGSLLASAMVLYGVPDPTLAYQLVAAIAGVYTVGRSMVKSFNK